MITATQNQLLESLLHCSLASHPLSNPSQDMHSTATAVVSTRSLSSEETLQEQDEVLKACSFILHDQRQLLEEAIAIIDQDHMLITRYQCSHHPRFIWKVSSRRNVYICFTNYCPCRGFLDQLKTALPAANIDGGKILCKHLLAIRIGGKLRKIKEEVVNNDIFVGMMAGDPVYQ